MTDAYVVGVDMIKFGRFPDKTVPEIGAEAAASPTHGALQRETLRVTGEAGLVGPVPAADDADARLQRVAVDRQVFVFQRVEQFEIGRRVIQFTGIPDTGRPAQRQPG